MGKSLIIKGADFSENGFGGTTWFLDRCIGALANTADLANGGWSFNINDNHELQGKTINLIKFKAYQAGTLNLYTATSRNAGSTVTLKASVTITSEDVGNIVTKEFTAFAIGSSEALVIGEANSAGGFYYTYGSTDLPNGTFYTKVPAVWNETGTGNVLGVAVGYKE